MIISEEWDKVGGGGGITQITQDGTPSSGSATKNYTLEVGKVYLLLVWSASSAAMPNNKFDSTVATGATITKLGNLYANNSNGVGTFFQLIPTQTSVIVTPPSNAVFILFTPS